MKNNFDKTFNAVKINFLGKNNFKSRNIYLRDGRSAILWEDQITGHGILDEQYWEDNSFYEEQYRKEFTSQLGQTVKNKKNLDISKQLNLKQFNCFSKKLNLQTKYIEIGCSFGGVLNNVVKHGVGEAWAVEPNKEDAIFAQNNNKNAKVINSLFNDSLDLPRNYFDMLVSIEVLEHVSQPELFLEKCYLHLKKGARIYLEVPNHHDVLYSTYDVEKYKSFYYHKAHIHYFTDKSLNLFCSKAGFKGDVSSFLMYPFFNHVFWAQNNMPQKSGLTALSTLQPAINSTGGKKINKFYKNVEKEYETLINELMLGDCLVYQGVKK